MKVVDLLRELKSFDASGVSNFDIMNAKNSTATVPAVTLTAWMNGEYDEDPGTLAEELKSLTFNQFINKKR